MTFLVKRAAPLVLGTGLAFLATAAFAAPGIVQGSVNLRSGPGTGYAVVDTLGDGQRVEVMSCTGKWCVVHESGLKGYVYRSLLENPYYPVHPYQFRPKYPVPGRTQPGR